jgi:hypothetical protein
MQLLAKSAYIVWNSVQIIVSIMESYKSLIIMLRRRRKLQSDPFLIVYFSIWTMFQMYVYLTFEYTFKVIFIKGQLVCTAWQYLGTKQNEIMPCISDLLSVGPNGSHCAGSRHLGSPRSPEPPIFLGPLRDLSVDEGTDITLSGIISGTQPINISWLHNGELYRVYPHPQTFPLWINIKNKHFLWAQYRL